MENFSNKLEFVEKNQMEILELINRIIGIKNEDQQERELGNIQTKLGREE